MSFTTQERSGAYPRVNNHAALPTANTATGDLYLVENATGTWLLGTKKKAGLYRSDGSNWIFQGVEIPQASGGELTSAASYTNIRRFSPANIATISSTYANSAITGRVQWMPNPTAGGTALVPGHTYIMNGDINTSGYYKLGSGSGHIHIIGNNYQIKTTTDKLLDFAGGGDGRLISIHIDGLRMVSTASRCIYSGHTNYEVNMRLTNCHIEADAQPLHLDCTGDFIAENTHFYSRSSTQNLLPLVRIVGGIRGRSKFTFVGCSFYQYSWQHVIQVHNRALAGLSFLGCSFRKTGRANNYYFIKFNNYHQTFINSTYASFKLCGGQFFNDGGGSHNMMISDVASSYWRTTCQISGIKYRNATSFYKLAFSAYYTAGTSGTYPMYVSSADNTMT